MTTPTIHHSLRDRARGAFWGLALGDALGMPTQSMSRHAITARFGAITTLVDAFDDQPIAPSMPAGSVTDDTEQAVLVADLLIQGHGHIAPDRFAGALAQWERGMAAKGSLDLLGPSTKAAIEAIGNGVPADRAGRRGTTNGAAMRITPVGIANPPEPKRLLAAVVEASMVTHNTGLGLSGAAAVAMAVSLGLDGADADTVVEGASRCAGLAAQEGAWIAGAAIGPRIRWAVQTIMPLGERQALDFVADIVGTSVASQESVVAAFAMASRFDHAPFEALCRIASLGGDTDTVACMAGAMLGARHGLAAWPEGQVSLVRCVNDLDLDVTVDDLLTLRALDN